MVTVDPVEKARARPIDGPYPELAKIARDLMGYNPPSGRPFLTTRDAARKTRVNHATISTMLRGDRASEESLRRFGEGLGGDVDRLLLAAGYLPSNHPKEQISMEFFDTSRFSLSSKAQAYIDPENLTKSVSPGYMAHFLSQQSRITYRYEVARSLSLFTYGEAPDYETKIFADYLDALRNGNDITQDIDDRYRLLFESCIEYHRNLFDIEENEANPENELSSFNGRESYHSYHRLVMMENQNAFALIGWYENRHDDAKRYPSLRDFADLFAVDTKAYQRTDFLPMREKLTQITNLWENQDRVSAYYSALVNGIEKNDASTRLLVLMFLGFYILLKREQDALTKYSEFMSKIYASSLVIAFVDWYASLQSI